jgi:hypothetical protein
VRGYLAASSLHVIPVCSLSDRESLGKCGHPGCISFVSDSSEDLQKPCFCADFEHIATHSATQSKNSYVRDKITL